MSGSKALVVIVIAILLSIAGIFLLFSSGAMDPAPLPGPGVTDTFPSTESLEELIRNLNSGSISGIALPGRLAISQSEHLTFMLGISNSLETQTTFHITLTQDSGPSSTDVEAVPREIEINPGSVGMVSIRANPGSALPRGVYSYTATICPDHPCSPGSAAYSTERFTFKVG